MSSEHAGTPLLPVARAQVDAPGAGRARRTPRRGRGRRYPVYVASRLLNPVLRKLAGGPRLSLFALVRHRGRRSGRLYATPVSARRTAEGFVISLTFGEGADWFRNVRAAGGCVIQWKGVEYTTVDPEVIDWATARSAFRPVERALIPLLGIERFARVRRAPASGSDRDATPALAAVFPGRASSLSRPGAASTMSSPP